MQKEKVKSLLSSFISIFFRYTLDTLILLSTPILKNIQLANHKAVSKSCSAWR